MSDSTDFSNKPLSNIFVTVGTTEFDELLQLLDSNPEFLEICQSLGCQRLTIQIGRGSVQLTNLVEKSALYGISTTVFRFKPTLHEEMVAADVVISHCGAGSIIEALRLHKLLVVVVNESLQGNHQTELSDELSANGYCLSTNVAQLVRVLKDLQSQISGKSGFTQRQFPQPDLDAFPKVLSEIFH